ncbi:lysosomal cystine transporter [Ophiostoma piceae UAMH 11346]|uniref:Lysosomal cystine transporter n=1 Tax=Ophiostoma piceae (strain UAMH 11346) TaxID=1262450 RepID=S3C2Y9_OPHP1|nr:lysosomal cystine transporter [Ophiostoma piceae UAMH 11346]
MDLLAVLSALFGWVYTFCWSLSFYPQPLLNARRRSTVGTTVDFPLVNCLGFLTYLLSTSALRYSASVRAEYAARHHGLTPAVAVNDVAFAAHALVLSLITLSQYLLPRLWWGSHQNDSETAGLLVGSSASAATPRTASRPSRFILWLMSGCVASVALVVVLVLQSPATPPDSLLATSAAPWAWLDVVYALGYVKLVVTLVKYSPQVLVNWRNRSTSGWSIVQILLDFSGGLLSIAQLLIDSLRQGDWSGVTGNPVKLLLGNVSMAYDVVFIVQHYVLYGEKQDAEADVDADADAQQNADRDGYDSIN